MPDRSMHSPTIPAGLDRYTVRASWTRRELLRGGATIVVGLSGAGFIAACGAPATVSSTPVPAASSPSPRVPEVSLAATDTTLDAPEILTAGIVRVSLENKGGRPSTLTILRLRDGKTFDDVPTDLAKPNVFLSSLSRVLESFGGLDGVLPGERRPVVLDLTAGSYALLSRVSGAPTGIAKRLEVSQASGASAPEPAADATVSLRDGAGPAVPSPAKAGTTWKVTNDGTLPHVLNVWRFKPGKIAADLAAFFATGGASGPVPAEVVAGSGLLSPGKHSWLTWAIAPGEYLDACTVPGRNPPANHFNEGESAKIVVG